MNKNTIIAAVAIIIALPLVFVILNSFKSDPLPRFRGREVVVIAPADGTITVPSAVEAKKGEPLLANFTSSFVERITTKKMTNTKGLNLTINTVSEAIESCEAESAVPARAPFKVAQMCAPAAFEKIKDPKKAAFFMVPEEQLIVFGQSGANHTKVYHNGMIATYDSADMTQSDRKYEACLVRIMMDYAIGLKPNEADACAIKP